eukprot:TRINITY_DN1109_c0_g1_i1.p2 TRINITY_DN1109_c0_g1~~TRINITY_DN1109_c0_g1_i1.p2  ORF type:complete len:612 (+),score=64.20 TRINITY_DN1109_c0_g1_i1:2469-4304(+)
MKQDKVEIYYNQIKRLPLMRIQVNCTHTSETTEKTWIETVFVKHNSSALHKNPLAYQNKLMSDYFSERITEQVMFDIIQLKETNIPAEFEEVVLSKYMRSEAKDPADQQPTEFDYCFDPHLEDLEVLPTPVRFLKFYYSKLPANFVEIFCKYLLAYKPPVPGPIAFTLGVIHDIGLGVSVNHKIALEYYMQSMKEKYPYAYYTLFDIFSRCYKTYGVERDNEKALRQMIKLLLHAIYCSDSWMAPKFIGDGPFGYLSVGFSHLDVYAYSCQYAKKIITSSKNIAKRRVMEYITSIEKKDVENAFKTLEDLTKECDDPILLIKIADTYLSGPGPVTKNQDKAREYLHKLAETKSESSLKNYGYEMLGYLLDTKGEYQKALECYTISVACGLPYSLKRYGISYAVGMDIERDLVKAEQFLMKSAAMGSSDAYLVLLEMYVYMKELRPQAWKLQEALQSLFPLFTTFEQDCCQLYKAMMLEKGMGIPINYPNAITIYSTLPKKDFPVALYRLGKVYEKKNNTIQAQQYYEDCYHNYMDIIKNWSQPHASTYIRVGKLYLKGKGCDKNVYRAKEILEKAISIKCCPTIPCLMRKKQAKGILERMKVVEEIKASQS